MPTGSSEENSLGWQLYLLRKRVGEWLELQTQRLPETEGFSISPWLETTAGVIFWSIVALLAAWLLWQIFQLGKAYYYRLKNVRSQATQKSPVTATKRSAADWRGRSHQYLQQKNYREACLCLYQAMLQQLDDRGMIPKQSSRTDGEYLQIIQALPHSQPYQTLLITHQQLCFGNTEATLSLLEECQQAYRAIEIR